MNIKLDLWHIELLFLFLGYVLPHALLNFSSSVIIMEQNSNVMTEVTGLIRSWEEEQNQQNYDPVPTLTRFLGLR